MPIQAEIRPDGIVIASDRHFHGLLAEEERHADDLLVMLQDVCGRCAADAWMPLAGALLDGYGRPEIVALLVDKLRVPRGIPRLWWAVRTTWMPRTELESRLALLRSRRREEAGTSLGS